MRRALLLEAGRFRAYVNDGKLHMDPAQSVEVLDGEDARALRELADAAQAEIAEQTKPDRGAMNDNAMRGMLAAAQGNWMQRLGGMFGAGVSPYDALGTLR